MVSMKTPEKKTQQEDQCDIHTRCTGGDLWLKSLECGKDEAGGRKEIVTGLPGKPDQQGSGECNHVQQEESAKKDQ